ncbi:MAG TPA: hypothetical protein VEB03_02235 [Candidatus Nanoarchaeia archaeon]|nr:hypothetical protein [Candidatus Nanoarchaeia archaeon]
MNHPVPPTPLVVPRCAFLLLVCAALLLAGCGDSGSGTGQPRVTNPLQVNSVEDVAQPTSGVVTLRSAVAAASSTDTITFASTLNGATVQLSIIGDEHSILLGEVYAPTFQGYSERDYGKSALYAHKNLTIDASSLPDGVTIRWTGGDGNPARVLAVYGNLTLKNVRITGGYSKAEPIPNNTSQPFTLARGGGIAVWGTATLENCAIYANRISGDLTASRDRGAYGGGVFANGLNIKNCEISGNTAEGYGAAGGGIYSVGGAERTGGRGNDTVITQSSISGNRTTAQHSYGGGIFTLSGGPNNLATMRISNSTIARNLVEDKPDLPDTGQFYYRGGGIYMGGGSLVVTSSTIVENEVRGTPAVFSNMPNIGGGGVAATIGNAHVVENVTVQQNIIAGNKINGAPEDYFSGSLLNFFSNGYNLLGVLDFRYILVPVPDWMNLSRKHYPKAGDLENVKLSSVVDLGSVHYSTKAMSAGTDNGPAVLWYSPIGSAVDRVPTNAYTVTNVNAGYTGFGYSNPNTTPPEIKDDFLNHAVHQAATVYAEQLGSDFESQFGNMAGTSWFGPAISWPREPANQNWITAWRNIDGVIAGRLGYVNLGDDFWDTFTTGPLCANETITVTRTNEQVTSLTSDQLGQARPRGTLGDVGAVER